MRWLIISQHFATTVLLAAAVSSSQSPTEIPPRPGLSVASERGFVPLSNMNNNSSNKIASSDQLRRDNKTSSRNLLTVTCGYSGSITEAGNEYLYELATLWASSYTTFCQRSTITIRKTDNNDGAAKVCGNKAIQPIVDIALMDRKLESSEAIIQSNGFSYQCVKDPYHRLVNEIVVATKGTGVMVKQERDGAAYACISSLGSLSLDQLRWIFSSFNTSQLIATGWDPSSLPNSDGNDNTHLWSELGGENCSDTEIRIAGPPVSSSAVALFGEIVFNASMHINNGSTQSNTSSTHETVAMSRPLGYFIGFGVHSAHGEGSESSSQVVMNYINTYPDAIGLFDLSDNPSSNVSFNIASVTTNQNQSVSVVVPIQDSEGHVVTANAATLGVCAYPICKSLFMYINARITSMRKTCPWLRFGFTPRGDTIVKISQLNPISDAQKADYIRNRLKLF